MERRNMPRIGVTGPVRGGTPAWLFTWLAVRRAGAKPVRITPEKPRTARDLDGLIVGGGADVTDGETLASVPAPRRSRPLPRRLLDRVVGPIVLVVRWAGGTRPHGADPARDRLELALLDEARQLGLPALGICRGAQLMNYLEGGTLQRNLHDLYEERARMYTVLPRREVLVAPDSHLARVLGRQVLSVNSLHHHAVAEPGEGMRVVARERCGVVQAVEHTWRSFWIGVQWHPEYLPQHAVQQRLFAHLVHHARAVQERRLERADVCAYGTVVQARL
jgi:putative glutamine amidotransferase